MNLSFDPESLRQLAALLNDSGLSELELSEGDRRLRLARAIIPQNTVLMTPQATITAPILTQPHPAPDLTAHPGAVKSPMVGVAYLAPEPSAPAFITLGQTVELGQTLLLIEAMKTFNQIKAPRAGTIRQILIATGQPVEYDEPLVVIE